MNLKRLMAVVSCGMLLAVVGVVQADNKAQEIMHEVIKNLRGPEGKMVVAIAHMRSPVTQYDIVLGLNIENGVEGVQIDVLSAADGAGEGARAGQKYRVVRDAVDPRALTYLPGLRRGRGRPFVPMDRVMQTDQRYYFLTLVSNLMHDFEYVCEKCDSDEDEVVVLALRKKDRQDELCPFPISRWYLKYIGDIVVLTRTEYHAEDGQILIVVYEEYTDILGAPGHLAPRKIATGDTVLFVKGWFVSDPPSWIMSKNHQVLELQNLPWQ